MIRGYSSLAVEHVSSFDVIYVSVFNTVFVEKNLRVFGENLRTWQVTSNEGFLCGLGKVVKGKFALLDERRYLIFILVYCESSGLFTLDLLTKQKVPKRFPGFSFNSNSHRRESLLTLHAFPQPSVFSRNAVV